MRVLFFGVISAVLCTPFPLSAQSIRLTDEKLLAEGAYKCGHWQLLILSFRAEEGVEGELVLSAGAIRFRARVVAPAHSKGVVKIPFFVPYPDAPMRLLFESEQEEIHFPEIVKRIRESMGTAGTRLSGCFGEVAFGIGFSRAFIDPTFLEDAVYLTQFDILIFSTAQKESFSEAGDSVMEFVENGGCLVEFEKRDIEKWELIEKERVGAGLLVRVAVPNAVTEQQSKRLADFIRSVDTQRRGNLSGIRPVPPPPYTDISSFWLLAILTFVASLGYIAFTLRFHPRFFRISLPLLLPAFFSFLLLLSPPASVWLIEAEVTHSDDSFGTVQQCLFVGSYAKTVWSPHGIPPFVIPIDMETAKPVSINAVYEDGSLVELELDRTPQLLTKVGVHEFAKQRAKSTIKNITERDWNRTYLFEGIWVFDYGVLRAGESATPERVKKRISRSDAFSEIRELTGLDVRDFVRNRDYIVALSGRKGMFGDGVRWLITPSVTFVRTD